MIFEPPTIRDATLSSTLSFVKYKFPFSAISPVSKVTELPSDVELELIVIALFASYAFAIEPANMAFVIPPALTCNVSELVSIDESST